MTKKIRTRTIGKVALAGIVILVIAYLANGYFNHTTKVQTKRTKLIADNTPDPGMALRDSIVNFGMELLGTPYVAAGCSVNGFDCSGFVYYVFRNFDIEVPRSSAQFEHFGTEVPIADVQKGDLLLFLSPTRNAIGHIGIVSEADGMKSEFIHASSGREMKVIVTSLSNAGYTKRFVKAVRVVGSGF